MKKTLIVCFITVNIFQLLQSCDVKSDLRYVSIGITGVNIPLLFRFEQLHGIADGKRYSDPVYRMGYWDRMSHLKTLCENHKISLKNDSIVVKLIRTAESGCGHEYVPLELAEQAQEGEKIIIFQRAWDKNWPVQWIWRQESVIPEKRISLQEMLKIEKEKFKNSELPAKIISESETNS